MTIKEWQINITAWAESKGFTWTQKDINTMLLRMHSEITEAGEAVRHDDPANLAEELADIFIRLANTAEVMGIDLEYEVSKKMEINRQRPHLHGKPNA